MDSDSPTYTIKRDRVTWIRTAMGRTRVSHPIVWIVAEDGKDVYTADTARAARAWIEAQS